MAVPGEALSTKTFLKFDNLRRQPGISSRGQVALLILGFKKLIEHVNLVETNSDFSGIYGTNSACSYFKDLYMNIGI